MDKINNLLKLATSYCERATWSYLVNKAEAKSLLKQAVESFTMPDDPEELEEEKDSNSKYDDIVNVARQLRDPELASELLLLAELYKKSIEVNGGYSSLNKSIGNIINMYLEDEDDPEQEAVEDLLNQVVKDLRERAGGPGALAKPDNPQAIAALKEVKDKYNSESIAEDMEELNKGQFDPTAGLGGGGDGGAAPNRGIMFRSRKTPKEWAEFFKTEKENYQDKLLTETNKFTRDKYSKLVSVLDVLSRAVTAELDLLARTSVLQKPDPKLEKALGKVRKIIESKKKERRSLLAGVRSHNLGSKQKLYEQELQNILGPNKELSKPTEEVYIRANAGDVRAREQIRLYHEIELQKTLQSNDLGKTSERIWRSRLIKSMSGGNWPGLNTIKNYENNIQKGSLERKSRTEYEKERGAKIKEHFEEGHDPEKRTRGKAKTFVGLVTDLQQKLATQKVVVKQTITDAIVNRIIVEQHTTFKPYTDKIAQAEQTRQEARKRKDKAAVDAATQIIKEVSKQMGEAMDKKAINAEAELSPQIVQFVEKLKPFYNFRDQAKIIAESIGENNIPQESWDIVSPVIEQGKALAKQFTGVQYMDTIAKAVSEIVTSLERRMIRTAQRYIGLTNILANSTLWKKYE